jgi:SAM-dependent methyltransferase
VICRICGHHTEAVVDLGESPPANSLLVSPTDFSRSFPLVLEHCAQCSNLQLRDCLDAIDLYQNYLYVTPDSQQLHTHYERLSSWLRAGDYINSQSFVLEVGSNIGLFLRFLQPQVRKVLGIDPAMNICQMATDGGVDTVCDFFNPPSAGRIRNIHGAPDVVIARHCLAHNRDPHVLVEAAAGLMSSNAHLVIENAYALNTVQQNEFDQIYHEHMFYFGIRSMSALLDRHGMHLVNVLLSPVHGGSIVFVAKLRHAADKVSGAVAEHAEREDALLTASAFRRFRANTESIRSSLRELVFDLVARGKRIYTYGATAKGNTLLNYVGITREHIPFCVDSTPGKQGRYLPQSLIRVISEEEALANPPDYFLLTAWNYREEIIAKVRGTGNAMSRFIVPVPSVEVV